jgi:hypothetical protein
VRIVNVALAASLLRALSIVDVYARCLSAFWRRVCS